MRRDIVALLKDARKGRSCHARMDSRMSSGIILGDKVMTHPGAQFHVTSAIAVYAPRTQKTPSCVELIYSDPDLLAVP